MTERVKRGVLIIVQVTLAFAPNPLDAQHVGMFANTAGMSDVLKHHLHIARNARLDRRTRQGA